MTNTYLKDKTIYAVDFDGTLSFGQWPEVGPANENLFAFLVFRQLMGDKVILWTCRTGKDLEDAVEFCRAHGLIFDAVNDNLPEIVEIFGENGRKISCDYYIDDKAVWVGEFEKFRRRKWA